MIEVTYLELEDLLIFTERLKAGPVRDLGLLDSAVARARSRVFGHEAYPTIELKAAALLQSIRKNHALVDGNKRLALLSTATFLRINGWRFEWSQDDAFDLIMAVAEGTLTDLSDIAARLRAGEDDPPGE